MKRRSASHTDPYSTESYFSTKCHSLSRTPQICPRPSSSSYQITFTLITICAQGLKIIHLGSPTFGPRYDMIDMQNNTRISRRRCPTGTTFEIITFHNKEAKTQVHITLIPLRHGHPFQSSAYLTSCAYYSKSAAGETAALMRDEIKRAGSVLLSHGRVPHYPRRWSP